MNKDKKTFSIIVILLFCVFFFTLFVPKIIETWMLAVLIVPFVVTTFLYVKKRSILSIYKKEVTFLMGIIALVYLMIFYVLGIKFGYSHNAYSDYIFITMYKYIIPLIVLIVGFEYIRTIMLQQNNKYVDGIVFVTSIIIEVMIYSKLRSFDNFNGFMDLVGLTIIPAFSANILYHYLSKKYGMHPNIVFRLITTLYLYVLPVIPNVVDLLMSFLSLVLPLIIYTFIKALYERKKNIVSLKEKRIYNAVYIFALMLMAFIVMLVSNQFTYKLIVIGSDSMSGSIDIGDAVIYKEYDNQVIDEEQIIVFEKDGLTYIHRVVRIERINNENRYYTKGDKNDTEDSGFILEGQIVGIYEFNIPYLGYPTLWLKEIFK